ncbi:MAG: ACT domain-containing protein [bacterium]|nr:ACT domain-containing protein [bacterium]
MRVSYQGEPGAFSDEAIRQLIPHAESVGFPTFDEAVETAAAGAVDAVLLPVENTIYGSVVRSYDLIGESALTLCGETIVHVRQCLIAPPGRELISVRSVASHPVAIEQCRRAIAQHGWQVVQALDTAGSVRGVLDGSIAADAAIAGPLAAERYGAEVLLADIQDDPGNYTRFLLAARDAVAQALAGLPPDRTVVRLELTNRRGSLHAALGLFAERGINLRMLLSRPIPAQPWRYRFYLEVDTDAEAVREALAALGDHGTGRVLGSYRGAER